MIDHITRFARIVHAIRQGDVVTSGPFTAPSRGGETTTQEWFYIGHWRVTRSDELMHRLRLKHARGGRETVADNADATEWTPQDMMKSSAEWDADAIDALKPLPAPGTDPVVDQIMALADGGWHQLGARGAVRIVADETDEQCPWTFEDQNHFASSPLKPLHDGLAEIAFYRRG